MSTIASQITSLTIVYSTIYSGADQSKHQSSASLAFVWGIHRDREFPAQLASNAENVSIWWRHHVVAETKLTCKAMAAVFDWFLHASPLEREYCAHGGRIKPRVTALKTHTAGPAAQKTLLTATEMGQRRVTRNMNKTTNPKILATSLLS